jgi:DNA-binding IclR family transcriptional regulator
MLRDIQEFLRRNGQACLADIAAAVGAPESAVAPMLELLEKKGRVRRVVMTERLCGGCTRCDPTNRIEWAWAEA